MSWTFTSFLKVFLSNVMVCDHGSITCKQHMLCAYLESSDIARAKIVNKYNNFVKYAFIYLRKFALSSNPMALS